MKKRNTIQKIIPARIIIMRTRLEMSQRDLCRALSEEYGREISPVTISTWETGRRPVPEKYITSLCAVFNCTYDYLAGLSNNEDEVFTEQSAKDDPDNIEINYMELKNFHKSPVYVEFNYRMRESGWALVDDKHNRFIFIDGPFPYQLSDSFFRDVHVFVKRPSHETNINLSNKKIIDLSTALNMKMVYIVYDSPSPYIRGMYNGWYKHNENQTCFINSNGLTLPYDGYGKAYKLYAPMNITAE